MAQRAGVKAGTGFAGLCLFQHLKESIRETISQFAHLQLLLSRRDLRNIGFWLFVRVRVEAFLDRRVRSVAASYPAAGHHR